MLDNNFNRFEITSCRHRTDEIYTEYKGVRILSPYNVTQRDFKPTPSMPSIVINEKGYKLFYEDSGAPTMEPEARYTTLMLVHGTGFHGGKLQALHIS